LTPLAALDLSLARPYLSSQSFTRMRLPRANSQIYPTSEGSMRQLAHVGQTAVGFAIDPTGRFLVACGEKSETISVHVDQASGALRLLRQRPGKGANWIEVVSTD
jgi:6-phosphogluconolactonase